MKITRRVTHRINMGNYEWIELSAETTDEAEGTAVPAMLEQLAQTLDLALKDDLDKAVLHTAESESYVHEWMED